MAARNTPDAQSALAVRQQVQNFLNAALTGNLDLLKKLAVKFDEGGKNGLKKTIEDIKDANKRGALHFAAREGKIDVCRYLLEELKLDVDTKDEDGETPLIHATRQGHVETAKYLISCGANTAARSDLGATALHHAAGTGCIELLQYLLSEGADVNYPSDSGTPLIWAAGHGEQEAVKILLDHNADPNAENDDDITPLLSAVAAASFPCLELLVKAGAKPNVSAGGATPLHIAADHGSLEILSCLLEAGADPNITDEDKVKPIEVAAAGNSRAAVEVLFPVTSPISTIPNWTVDGIIEYMQSGAHHNAHEEKPKADGTTESTGTIPEVTPEAKKKSLEAKARGEDAFRRKDFLLAVDAYTQAFDCDPSNAVLLSNRSLCWLRLGQGDQALTDAKACRALNPNWAKACYREGAALRLLQRFEDAANAFYEGVILDPENKELVNAFREAVEAGKKFHSKGEQKKEG